MDSLTRMSAPRHRNAEIQGKPMDGEKTRGADARKVRLLLKTAGLDRRLS